jgi:hypothetical protein
MEEKMNLTILDIGLTKMSVLFATLFLVSAWQGFSQFAMNTHWAYFLVASLILAIKPMMAVFKK